MKKGGLTRGWIILLAVAVVAGLVATTVLWRMGTQGAQIATIIGPYLALLSLLATVRPLLPQRSSKVRLSSPAPPPPWNVSDIALFDKLFDAVRRQMSTYQIIGASVIALITLAYCLYVTDTAPSGGFKTLTVKGSVTLLEQDKHLNDQRALVFQLSDGRFGYLARPDDRWWLPWSSINLAPAWPGFTDDVVFASLYTGLEFLGIQSGVVMFAYRDNVLHWYDPTPILVNGLQLTGVSANPGFMQYTWSNVNPQFLALIPDSDKGLGLYERVEKPPWEWVAPTGGRIGAVLGKISAVSAAEFADGTLCVVVRTGSHLFELTHPALIYSPDAPPSNFSKGWSAPAEIRAANGIPVSAAGYPQLIATSASASGATNLLLAVPVHGGAVLLSSTEGSVVWNVQRLPINHDVDALTLLTGRVSGRANIDIAYREGNQLLDTWQWDGGPWHAPVPVEWSSGS